MKYKYLKCPDCGTEMRSNPVKTGQAAKRKGNGYEHRVAKFISNLTKLRWKKTPRSGGLHIAGDVFCLDFPTQPFAIECKDRERIDLSKIFKNPNSTLTDRKTGEPLVSEEQIMVFNNHGQHLMIVRPCLFKSPTWLAHQYAEVHYRGFRYILLDLKHFKELRYEQE
jgi:hypothetical protein